MLKTLDDAFASFFAPLRLCVKLLSALFDKLVFGELLRLIVLIPIPYGTVEPWWKAAFVCAVFGICILAIIESLLTSNTHIHGKPLLLPMLALSALAFIQTL